MSAPKDKVEQVASLDFFPFRGQYGPHYTGGSLFPGVRALVIAVSYSLFKPSTSVLSFYHWFLAALPRQSMLPGPVNIPGVPRLPSIS